VLGEANTERVARQAKRLALLPKGYDGQLDPRRSQGLNATTVVRDTAVSPFAPAVQSVVTQALQTIAQKSGTNGVVLTDLTLPGYNFANEYDVQGEVSDALLGYTPEMRLAFLRAHSVDPIDVSSPNNRLTMANTDITNYMYDGSATQAAYSAWFKFRRQLDCLQKLYNASTKSKTPLFCLEHVAYKSQYNYSYGGEERFNIPYTIWSDSKKEPPAFDEAGTGRTKTSIIPIRSDQPLRQQLRNGKAKFYTGFVLETKEKSIVQWEKEINTSTPTNSK
jgi:hypothetical protein